MGPIKFPILGGLFSKTGPGLVLIDTQSGKMEKVFAEVDGKVQNFLGGPWAWLPN
jgi:hypothetical protein